MSHADDIAVSRQLLIALFDGTPDHEAQVLIEELAHRYDPPIRVVQESIWALKAGGLAHCAVCQHVKGVRAKLPRERAGRCPEHAIWKIFYRHHSWDASERNEAALLHMKRWLRNSDPESSMARATEVADQLVCNVCGVGSRWGEKTCRCRLSRRHNSWLAYLKVLLYRIHQRGEDKQ